MRDNDTATRRIQRKLAELQALPDDAQIGWYDFSFTPKDIHPDLIGFFAGKTLQFLIPTDEEPQWTEERVEEVLGGFYVIGEQAVIEEGDYVACN